MFKEWLSKSSNKTAPEKEPFSVKWNEKREVRLKKTGPLLLLKRKDGKLESGWFVNTTKHTSFTPAFRIEVKSDKLAACSFPFIFKFFYGGENSEQVYEIPVDHVFKKGKNIIFPPISIPVNNISHGTHRFQVLIPADIVFEKMDFSVIKTRQEHARVGKDGVFEYDEIDPRDVSIQDLVDLLEQE